MGGRSNSEGVSPRLLLSCFLLPTVSNLKLQTCINPKSFRPSAFDRFTFLLYAGIGQLRAIIEPMGMRLTVVPTSKVLHLKSAVTALPDGKIIGHLPFLDADHPFHDVLPTPGDESNGAHVVRPT
jgi:hypothetical protein